MTNVMEIKLTRGYSTLVDAEMYDELSKYKWRVRHHHHTSYAQRSERLNGKYSTIQLHRQVLGLKDRNIIVDHKDRNGLNNQSSNLRIATRSQNSANRRPTVGATSNYLGVCFITHCKKWRASIERGGEKYNLGEYKKEIDAAEAYNKKAIELHGEFANLNVLPLFKTKERTSLQLHLLTGLLKKNFTNNDMAVFIEHLIEKVNSKKATQLDYNQLINETLTDLYKVK